MFIRTQRLFLRPPFPEDWREIYRGINDAGVVRMLARAPWPYGPEDAQAFCGALRDPLDLQFAITLPGVEGSPIIGAIGMDCTAAVPDVGYWIGRGHRGKGYASEALAGVLEIARTLGVQRLSAGHYLDNPASGAVLKKAGFVETGEVRPTHALGRGGQLVLSRRYGLELGQVESVGRSNMAQDSRKPA
ncbi:GNAT family N-acetyltransferase [Altererythrobacter sp. KTW20L]|uniref:GNAT family N-acetyltransferase n=1 Tax=Altererythrobacter sp. KTW20L TaxID=2942210 RepID=UPI0020BEF76B|nr:GNAT family N-acetyltransferase [Altererythrobacter sp. KTW20L]MCL6250647.1 GNAT family N-acetyltransferase [Altererythrobacter sp. KTW20L]